MYQGQEIARGKDVQLDADLCDIELVSDRALLHRILSNMIKNALEACQPGEMVTVGCTEEVGAAKFWVHNPGRIPMDIQLQVFQRSFSTKGPGRGLGTYSIKLLGEMYLGGKVSFSSSDVAGTVFRIILPIE